MRVTNSMMSNSMLLNIYKNMRNIDKLWNQQATTKKVNYPSDDPILASRALKFRAMVSETEQYQRNVEQGLSWMEITDYAVGQVVDVLTAVSELNVQGASDQFNFDDRQKIADNIEVYMNELSSLMLSTYAGRYIFSGYRTDQPTTYQDKAAGDNFTLTQNFVGKDIEKIKSYQKLAPTREPLSYEADIVKLAYDNTTGTEANPNISISINGIPINTANIQVHHLSNNPPSDPSYIDTENAFLPGDDEVHYIPETGELVLGKNIATSIRNGATLETTYNKEGFKKGDLNPRVYFPCTENSAVPVRTWNKDSAYTMDDHLMRNEFGVGMTMEINALGKNIFTDKLIANMRSIIDLIHSVELSDEVLLREEYIKSGITDEDALKTAVDEQITREKQRLTDILQTKFSNFIDIVQKESSSVSTQYTNIGTRMKRLELISQRLKDDRLSYKKLMSDNEDVDVVEVSLLLSEATAAYNASLQAGSSIIQMTLANFIR